MKLHEPFGNPIYAPLFLRLGIGSYFMLAGLAKLEQPDKFVEQVNSFAIVPKQIGTLYGILLPYLEVGVGGLLLGGFWTTLAGMVASILLMTYIYAFGTFPGGQIMNKDLVLLSGTISLMYSGAGALSIDRFRKNG